MQFYKYKHILRRYARTHADTHINVYKYCISDLMRTICISCEKNDMRNLKKIGIRKKYI